MWKCYKNVQSQTLLLWNHITLNFFAWWLVILPADKLQYVSKHCLPGTYSNHLRVSVLLWMFEIIWFRMPFVLLQMRFLWPPPEQLSLCFNWKIIPLFKVFSACLYSNCYFGWIHAWTSDLFYYILYIYYLFPIETSSLVWGNCSYLQIYNGSCLIYVSVLYI